MPSWSGVQSSRRRIEAVTDGLVNWQSSELPNELAVMAVEGKVRELRPISDRLAPRRGHPRRRSNLASDSLAKTLGTDMPICKTLRYQLMHPPPYRQSTKHVDTMPK